MKLTAEHQVTVAAGQDKPHGQEFEPIDKSVIGTDIKIEKSSEGSRK